MKNYNAFLFLFILALLILLFAFLNTNQIYYSLTEGFTSAPSLIVYERKLVTTKQIRMIKRIQELGNALDQIANGIRTGIDITYDTQKPLLNRTLDVNRINDDSPEYLPASPRIIAFFGGEIGTKLINWLAEKYENITQEKDAIIARGANTAANLFTQEDRARGDVQRKGFLAKKKEELDRYKANGTLLLAVNQAVDENLDQILSNNPNLSQTSKDTLIREFEAVKTKLQGDMKNKAGEGGINTVKMDDIVPLMKSYLIDTQKVFPTGLNVPPAVNTILTQTQDFVLGQLQDTAKDVATKVLTKAGRDVLRKGIKIAKIFTPTGLLTSLATELLKFILITIAKKNNENKVCPLGYSDAKETENNKEDINFIGMMASGDTETVVQAAAQTALVALGVDDLADSMIAVMNQQPQFCIGLTKNADGSFSTVKAEKDLCKGERHVYSCYGASADDAWKQQFLGGIVPTYFDENALSSYSTDEEILKVVRPFTYQTICDMCAQLFYEYTTPTYYVTTQAFSLKSNSYYYTIRYITKIRFFTGSIVQVYFYLNEHRRDNHKVAPPIDDSEKSLFFLFDEVNFAPASVVPSDKGRVRKTQWEILSDLASTKKCEGKGLEYYVISGCISGYVNGLAILTWNHNRPPSWQINNLPFQTVNYVPKTTFTQGTNPIVKCERPLKQASNLLDWVTTSSTKMGGKDQGNEFDIRCKNGYITKFTVGESDRINRIQASCSDGEKLSEIGKGGNTIDITTRDGFNKLNVRSGELIDSIEFNTADQVISREGGGGGSVLTSLDCEFGKIIGIRGTFDDNIRQLSAICGTAIPKDMLGLRIVLGLFGILTSQINVTDTLRAKVKNNTLTIPEITPGAMGLSLDAPPSNLTKTDDTVIKYLNLPATDPLRKQPLRLWIIYSWNGTQYRVSASEGKSIEIKGPPTDLTRERFNYQRISPRINKSQVLDPYPNSGLKVGLSDYDANNSNELVSHTPEGAIAFNVSDKQYTTAPLILTANEIKSSTGAVTGYDLRAVTATIKNTSEVIEERNICQSGTAPNLVFKTPINNKCSGKIPILGGLATADFNYGTLTTQKVFKRIIEPTPLQRWSYNRKKQFTLDSNPNLCLTAGPSPNTNQFLTLQTCNDNNLGQIWETARRDNEVLDPSEISSVNGSLRFNNYFDGTGLEYVADDGFNIGTGAFTVEWWQFQTGDGVRRVFSIGNYSTAIFAAEVSFGRLTVWVGGTNNIAFDTGGHSNRWIHFAIVGDGVKTIRLFQDGILKVTNNTTPSTGYNLSQGPGRLPLMIGNESIRKADTAFIGLITNFHWVKGRALYTANFTPSSKPIVPTANTELLLLANMDDPLKDSSGKNRIATNYNVSYSSQSPFP